MRIALIDPFAGIAGDMLVGALLHAGAPLGTIRKGLAALGLEGLTVSVRKVRPCGVAARRFLVRHRGPAPARGLSDILRLLERLPDGARDRARAAFERLGAAEAEVHGCTMDEVHFHEVGAVDSIADIVAAALALETLEVDRIHCRPLPLGRGSVRTEHGILPLPAPATIELLKGRPVFDSGREGEWVTPTGAAMVSAWAEAGDAPALVPGAVGYGAGTREYDDFPNVCRVTLGRAPDEPEGALWELVCDVDDATPQVLGRLPGLLLEAGALDATLSPLLMKKGRPGTRVTALVRNEHVPSAESVLFREGTTLGVRRRRVERTELERRIVSVRTEHGDVRIKLGVLAGEVVHVAPEYEDCRALADATGLPLREITRLAMAQWRR